MASEPRPTRERIVSIDVVRGLVMAIMLLDHTRDFVHAEGQTGDPLDLATTTYPLYFTRWVTHFCAPVFVFLAGTSARLRGLRGASDAELSRYLATRGLWLIALELVVLRPLIWFNFDSSLVAHLQVIWAIGISMLVLSLLVFLPFAAVAAIGLAIVAGHNWLDRITVSGWRGPQSPAPDWADIAWMLLHQRGVFPIGGGGGVVLVHYPVLPWIGTLACGYAFGQLFAWDPTRRRRAMSALGAAACALFVLLRWINRYGDPDPWSAQERAGFTLLSFLDTEKYPPSLLYLAMTLGPAMLALAWLDGREPRWLGRRLLVLGSVPLFFYLLQWPAAHLASKFLQLVHGHPTDWDSILPWKRPTYAPGEIGSSLPVVYAAWAVLLLALYPLCAWYARFRRAHPQWRWLTYL